MEWDGNLYFCPTTSYHPITITQLSDTSTIPYHLPQLLPSHPTHHDKTFYHPNTIPSVSHLSHVHTNTIVYHPKPSIRSLLRDVPTRLPARTKAIQGGRHAFVDKAINDLAVLETSLSLDTQEIRSLDPYDGPRTATAVADLLSEVQDLLNILEQDFPKRGLERALDDVEKIACCSTLVSSPSARPFV